MKVFNFPPFILCERNWETSHSRTVIDDRDQLLADHNSLTIRCMSEESGSLLQ